jgi:hypothetical protein
MKNWQPQPAKWDWRSFLSVEEAAVIARSDAALVRLEKARQRYEQRFGRERQLIVNRAIQRAKYDARERT